MKALCKKSGVDPESKRAWALFDLLDESKSVFVNGDVAEKVVTGACYEVLPFQSEWKNKVYTNWGVDLPVPPLK